MKKILITCDTEVGELGRALPNAFDTLILGKIQNKEFGVHLINKLANQYKASIEHFVDIYPIELCGEQKFSQLCNSILQDGHGLNLHTHPLGLAGYTGRYMHNYSLAEQEEILTFGIKTLKKWTGLTVHSHRAGGYGVNQDTYKALDAVGIKNDFSYYFQNAQCHVTNSSVNAPFICQNVKVYPVSVAKVCSPLRKNISYFKLDMRYGLNTKKILAAIDSFRDPFIINIFMHSFNFLTLIYNFQKKIFTKITVNNKQIKEFEAFLSGITARSNCQFAKIADLPSKFSTADYTPELSPNSIIHQALRTVGQKFMHSWAV